MEESYGWKGGKEREREKETVALQGSITRNCELWYLLHQVPCGLLHWDSVWKKRTIINHTEREREKSSGQRKLTENQKSIERKSEVETSERK